MIRTILVEDEPLARDLLRSYIAMLDDSAGLPFVTSSTLC